MSTYPEYNVLGSEARVSHGSHNLYGWIYRWEGKDKNPLTGGANYSGQAANESVKTTRPGRLFMAGFAVFMNGRFSGVHRGTKVRAIEKGDRCLPPKLSILSVAREGSNRPP
jgi:hypothetical protein